MYCANCLVNAADTYPMVAIHMKKLHKFSSGYRKSVGVLEKGVLKALHGRIG